MRSKADLRAEARELARTITPEWRRDASLSIVKQLRHAIECIQPKRIALYMALRDEPDLGTLIDELALSYAIYLPRVLNTEAMGMYRYTQRETLQTNGIYSIYEPSKQEECIFPDELDLIVVPAVAFDYQGYRLGRGKGYYDRYLAKAKNAHTIGVSLGLLRPKSLPIEPWDRPIQQILYP